MLKVVELFGGIGACSKALERLGVEHEIVDYVEIDKYAVKSFNAVHGTNFEPQDITEWDKDMDVDLIMHGSPCQDFSVAGKNAGGDKGSGTRSSLMYETLRIVEKIKPKYVIWENVKNLLSEKHRPNFEAYQDAMEDLGYSNYYQVLNAKDYGVPQNRERVFTISIRKDIDNGYEFPEPIELDKRLKDVIDEEVEEKYYLSDEQVEKILESTFNQARTRIQDNDVSQTILARDWKDPKCVRVGGIYDGPGVKHQAGSVYDPRGIAATLDTMGGGNREPIIMASVQKDNSATEPKVIGGIGDKKSNGGTQWYLQNRVYDDNVAVSVTASVNPYYKSNYRIRKLTPKECWRLMGFDDSDFEKAEKVNSNTQLYKQAGNSIVVNVLESILKELLCQKGQ